MTALERIAREIGIALAECGADDASPLAGELAEMLAELAREPSALGRRRHLSRRRRGRRSAARGD